VVGRDNQRAKRKLRTGAKDGAIVGVSDHCGWAVLVTVASDATVLDRRRVELLDADLPKLPYHHEAQTLPLEEALSLIERVRISAEKHARLSLDFLATAVAVPIRAVAIRECPLLPPTVAERIRDYRAQNRADTVMYRNALAGAAEARGWAVHWYDVTRVLEAACEALRVDDLDAHFREVRTLLGPPWSKDQKIAMAAAIAAAPGEGKLFRTRIDVA
jgi:hypothetical protein